MKVRNMMRIDLYKVIFISGPMRSGKSKVLIDLINMAKQLDYGYLIYKPDKDTRDGYFVKSRYYNEVIEAKPYITNNTLNRINFYNDLIDLKKDNILNPVAVFFDEVHFLNINEVKFIVDSCKSVGITLIMSGLETSFTGEFFESSLWLKENASDYEFIFGECDFCGNKNAIFNLRVIDGVLVEDGPEFMPGDDIYKVSCYNCRNYLKSKINCK